MDREVGEGEAVSFDWDPLVDLALSIAALALLWTIHPALAGILVIVIVASYL